MRKWVTGPKVSTRIQLSSHPMWVQPHNSISVQTPTWCPLWIHRGIFLSQARLGYLHIPLTAFVIPTHVGIFLQNFLPSKQEFILSSSGMKVTNSAGIQQDTKYSDPSGSNSLNFPKNNVSKNKVMQLRNSLEECRNANLLCEKRKFMPKASSFFICIRHPHYW